MKVQVVYSSCSFGVSFLHFLGQFGNQLKLQLHRIQQADQVFQWREFSKRELDILRKLWKLLLPFRIHSQNQCRNQDKLSCNHTESSKCGHVWTHQDWPLSRFWLPLEFNLGVTNSKCNKDNQHLIICLFQPCSLKTRCRLSWVLYWEFQPIAHLQACGLLSWLVGSNQDVWNQCSLRCIWQGMIQRKYREFFKLQCVFAILLRSFVHHYALIHNSKEDYHKSFFIWECLWFL